MKKIFFDKSVTIPLFARKGDSGNSVLLSFFDEYGHEFTEALSKNWLLTIYKRNTTKPVLSLTEGNGLELVEPNCVRILQESITLDPDTYFYKLFSLAEESTWLNGSFVVYGNLEKEVLENKKSVIVGSTTVRINVVSGNIFIGGVQTVTNNTDELNFDGQRELYIVRDEKIITDITLSFVDFASTKRFLYIFSVDGTSGGVTITVPDFCFSKSAEWNGNVAHSFTFVDDDKFIIEGIWDNEQFRLIVR